MNEIPKKFKIYTGRIFLLRNKKYIPCTLSKVIGRERMLYLSNKEFGEGVFVYDETNSRVQIIKNDGKLVWIPKNCLLKELETDSFELKNNINELIQDLLKTNLSDDKKNQITSLLRSID